MIAAKLISFRLLRAYTSDGTAVLTATAWAAAGFRSVSLVLDESPADIEPA